MQGRLTWPTGLKVTAIRSKWFAKVAELPPGLDLAGAGRLLGEPYGAVRRWAVRFGYQFPDRRRAVSPEQWGKVDWTCRDADIARELGVTRECVRLVRNARGAGPSAARQAVRRMEHWIEDHRDRLHGLLVEEVIHHSRTDLPYHVVRRILRDRSVRPHQPYSSLRNIDWRLPNRDLADVWGTSARYVANLRARLGAGPSIWSARDPNVARDLGYRAALAQERRKAQVKGHHGGGVPPSPKRAPAIAY